MTFGSLPEVTARRSPFVRAGKSWPVAVVMRVRIGVGDAVLVSAVKLTPPEAKQLAAALEAATAETPV